MHNLFYVSKEQKCNLSQKKGQKVYILTRLNHTCSNKIPSFYSKHFIYLLQLANKQYRKNKR